MKTKDVEFQPRPLVAEAFEHPARNLIDWHSHRRSQLLYAISGTMNVRTHEGFWVVPPNRAVWVPGDTLHQVHAGDAAVSMRTLKIEPVALRGMPPNCCVVSVTPLLRELIVAAVRIGADYSDDGADARLIDVLLDQITTLPVAPLYLPGLRDRRLRRVAEALQNEPSANTSASEWAAKVGMSARHFSRQFQNETGMSFREWRQQLRLLRALQQLAQGRKVNAVALDLGYATTSAFVAMFRRALGTTPARYFSADE